MIYLAWIIFLALLTFAFNRYLQRQNNPNQQITTTYNAQHIAEVTLQQNRQGHYVVNGKINQKTVTFLLDTGATRISIPESIANQLGLEKRSQSRSRTANGSVMVFNTRLDTVSIGAIELNNIRASINPYQQGNEILLGMNFMKHLEMIQRGDKLTLRYYPVL